MQQAARPEGHRRSASASSAAATNELIQVALTRDEVNIPTVPAYFMIDATTGYIRMQDFGENTDRDVKHALHELASKGMKRLLFDIRGNPGGPLDQAIKVVERVPAARQDDRLHARPRAELGSGLPRHRGQRVHRHPDRRCWSNRNSASASEIVTGALQDHDRAYIVGETTFGKALVQSVYRISGGAGLALTTAHYYTPSGRLIQRPWDATFDEYLSYTLRDQDANKPHNPSDLKRTDAGPPGLQRRRHRAGQARRRTGRRLQPGALRPHARTRAASSRTTRRSSRAEGDTRITQTSTGRKIVKPQLRRRRRDGGRLPRAAEDRQGQDRRRRRSQKDLDFIKAMIRFEIDDAVFGIADARRHLHRASIRRRRSRCRCSARPRS